MVGGYGGGFAPDSDPAWENIGCNCNGDLEVDRGEGFGPGDDECPRFAAEVGAGWFTGDYGVATFCKPTFAPTTFAPTTSTPTSDDRRELYKDQQEDQDVVPDDSTEDEDYEEEEDDDEEEEAEETLRELGSKKKKNKFGQPKKCPYDNINRMYAWSQDEKKMGGSTLNVDCTEFDGQVSYEGFLETSAYYGFIDVNNPSLGYEMIPSSPKDRMPRVCTSCEKKPDKKVVSADKFIEDFYKAVTECVDPAAQKLYKSWLNGLKEPPFDFQLVGEDSDNWFDLDREYPTIPTSDFLLYNETATKKNLKKMEWCKKYIEVVQSYISDGTGIPGTFTGGNLTIDGFAEKLLSFYTRFYYLSEYLAEDISVYNFGESYYNVWNENINYSVDQRGLKEVVERILPWDDGEIDTEILKLNHNVTKIDYTGNSLFCPPNENSKEYTVEVLASVPEGFVRYCAKRVISTVSFGVIQNDFETSQVEDSVEPEKEETEGQLFQPIVNTDAAPYAFEGNLIKLYFRFPEKFWGSEEYVTFMMTESFRKNETGNFVRADYLYNLNDFFVNEESVEDTKSLFMFVSSPDIDDILQLSDEGIPNEVLSERIWKFLDPLRFKYGDDYVEPNCWFYYNWGTDPFQYGAYGVWKRGATYYDFNDFFAPRLLGGETNEQADFDLEYKYEDEIDPAVLYISGSQSCLYYWGFIEGGYESGSRDARRAIKSLMGRKAKKVSTFSACGAQNSFFEDCLCEGAFC
jgi:hypothetical protein